MNGDTSKRGQGYLRVLVRAGGGTIPISDAMVLVYGTDRAGGNTDVLFSLRTDEDGITATVPLAAPPAAESMTPGYPEPFGRYNVTVQKTGYGTVENINVPIFDGVVSTQPVGLVPLSEFETDADGIRKVYESPEGQNPLL